MVKVENPEVAKLDKKHGKKQRAKKRAISRGRVILDKPDSTQQEAGAAESRAKEQLFELYRD